MKQMVVATKLWIVRVALFSWLAAIMSVSIAQAETVSYALNEVIMHNDYNGQEGQMTGIFSWTYDLGDFENGVGTFSQLFIPWLAPSDYALLVITFDIGKSIEFSLTANVHGGGVNVTLFLLEPLTPTQAAFIDLSRSSYEIESNLSNGGFVSGSISPSAVPVPTAVWLFGTGLIGLIVMPKRYKVQGKIN